MAHLFCHSCGTKIEYAHAQPNFCVKCGQALNSIASVKRPEPEEKAEQASQVSEDETDAEFVPSLGSIQVHYEAGGNKTFTLGSLAGEKTPPDYKPRRGRKTVDEFIDERRG